METGLLYFSNMCTHDLTVFTLKGCAHEEGLNSHDDLPHGSRSDSIMERDLSGERVFINPPWELAE
jgi:hypothetical protein